MRKRLLTGLTVSWFLLSGSAAGNVDRDAVPDPVIVEIRIIGLETTKEWVVRRELASRTGDPYSPRKVAEDYRNLDRLGIFSEISIYPAEEDSGVVLFVIVEETFPYIPVVSVSIDDENGLSAGGGLKSVNLLGRGIYFSGGARFGGAFTTEIALRHPWVAGDHIGYEIEYYRRERRNEIFEFDETADEVYLTVSSYAGSSGRVGVRLWYQGIAGGGGRNLLSADGRDEVAGAALFAGVDTRDIPSNPHRGWWSEAELGRSGIFGSDSDFWRMRLDLRRFAQLAPRQTLAFFTLLTLSSGSVGEEMARWQQYAIGGSNSVRGWSLGSKAGGSELLGTLEYRLDLMPPRPVGRFGVNAFLGLQLAVFLDAGTVWNGIEEAHDNLLAGGGLGARLIVPYVDMVRFDLGFGEQDEGFFVHIAFGGKADAQRRRVR